MRNNSDFFTILAEHVVEEYERDFCCNANITWHKIDCILFLIYVKQENSKVDHWVLKILTFFGWWVLNDSCLRQTLLPYLFYFHTFWNVLNFTLRRIFSNLIWKSFLFIFLTVYSNKSTSIILIYVWFIIIFNTFQ